VHSWRLIDVYAKATLVSDVRVHTPRRFVPRSQRITIRYPFIVDSGMFVRFRFQLQRRSSVSRKRADGHAGVGLAVRRTRRYYRLV